MQILKSKEQILQENNYTYNYIRKIYFNRESKKIFSFEAIEDNPEFWLQQCIAEPNKEIWEFYFNDPKPSNSLINEIIAEIK